MSTPVSCSSFGVRVFALDSAGQQLTKVPGGLYWSVDSSGAATVSTDSNHAYATAYRLVTVAAPDESGNYTSFTISVTDGDQLSGTSDTLVPTTDYPASLGVAIL